MKHVLQLVAGLCLTTSIATAQVCSPNPPDPNAPELGFNPNPIPAAIAGSNYDHQNTVVIPEYVDDPLTPGDSLPLCGIKIYSVEFDTATSYNSTIPAGLNFTWEVWQGSTQITTANMATQPVNITAGSGVVRICLRLQSTNVPNPVNAPCDSVSFKVQIQGRLDLGLGCLDVPSQQAPPAEFFIKWPICATQGLVEFSASGQFELLQNFPNPADANTSISFNTPKAGNAQIEVRDMMGRIVLSESINADFGINNFNLETTGLSDGIYLYSVSMDQQTLSGKMLIKH